MASEREYRNKKIGQTGDLDKRQSQMTLGKAVQT